MLECPRCKSYNTEPGYGLAGGGGIGLYMYCNDCGNVYAKAVEKDEKDDNGQTEE